MNDLIEKETKAPLALKKAPIALLKEQVEMLEACRALGQIYAKTAMVPKQYQGHPEDAAVAIQWGAEIGLAPLQALQNVAVVNGNATLWGDALVALAKGSGVCEYLTTQWDEQTKTAIVTTKRKGEPEESRSYSLADAQMAGLASRDTYKKFPKRMISHRARSHLLRDVYADILKGFNVREVVEEDDAAGIYSKPEKDITPPTAKKKAIDLLSRLQEKSEQSTPEPVVATTKPTAGEPAADSVVANDPAVVEQPVNDPEGNTGFFDELLMRIQAAENHAELNSLGQQIDTGRDSLTNNQINILRSAWKQRSKAKKQSKVGLINGQAD